MISQVVKSSFIALGIGFMSEMLSLWLQTTYLIKFFSDNLITILVALLAVNAATMGIVLTKIRDLIDKNGGAEYFKSTKEQMLLSIKEQVALIILAITVLSMSSSPIVSGLENISLFVNSVVTGIFAYALIVLYDTAKGVLIIVDYDG